jgi:hypothetical protein
VVTPWWLSNMSGLVEAFAAPLRKYVTRILQTYLGKYIKGIQLDGAWLRLYC